MKLNSVTKGSNGYCGPAAISAITGVDTGEAARLIREHGRERRKAIKGVYLYELKYTLQAVGYEVEEHGVLPKPQRPTLARWLREREDPNAMTLVFVSTHFVVVKGRKLVDNHTGDPVWISKAPGRRKRVRNWLTIRKSTGATS